jgi:predicted branched-subunit amino acid permease
MDIKINLAAYGILTVAIIAMFLYFLAAQIGRPDIGSPLLTLVFIIVIAFLIYMFMKLLMQRT